MIKPNTLIIGGTSTFGRTIAHKLLLAGHNLFLTFFSQEKENCLSELIKLSKSKKSALITAQLDITDESQVKKIIGSSQIKFNNLVYTVGASTEFRTVDKDDWNNFEMQFAVQVKGLWLTITKLLEEAHPLKSVLVIGSACLFNVPPARLFSYTVGKYGQLGLVRCLANELASRKIRVNMISPGVSGEGISAIYPETFIKLIKSQTPLKRLVNDRDVACLAKFLLSDEAEYLTGLNIPIDGGLHMM